MRATANSDLAIELVLTLRLIFHLAFRQAEAFSGSVLALLGLDLAIRDHTTLSRRGRAFAGRQPRVARHDRPVHLLLDSTRRQLFGQAEGTRRSTGVPADSGASSTLLWTPTPVRSTPTFWPKGTWTTLTGR